MSKKKQKVVKKNLSQNEKKTIIIAAIALAMAVIIAVTLGLMLKPKIVIPDDNSSSSGSSTLTIKNGDFAYFDDETDTYPKTADNWTKRTYQEYEENKTHGFDEIQDDSNVVAGVVPADEDSWSKVQSDLKKAGVSGTIAFPDVHEGAVDKNIYMFATKKATTAAIFSQTFSIASQVSAKVTVRLNTAQLKDDSYAVVMFQNGSGTLKADDSQWYAYDMSIGKTADNEWVEYEFYLFNRKSSSAIIVCSVGLGNCFNGEEAEGVLFIDDIEYKTVSANEYRKFHDKDSEEKESITNYYIIEGDNSTDEVEYTTWTEGWDGDTFNTKTYLENESWSGDEQYSPFINDEVFEIYKLHNDGKDSTAKMLVLSSWNEKNLTIKSSEDLKDHLHIGFWLRTVNENGNAFVNIILQSYNTSTGKWEDVKNGSFKSIETSQDIENDNNCGWVKYDIYVKPTSATETQIKLLVVLGRQEGYEGFESTYYPQGTLYASSPIVEEISATEYKNGTGSYAKQISLTAGIQASFSISNGSFSNYTTTNKNQPTNWTPVYAGQNEIYRDGKGEVLPDGVTINKNPGVSSGAIEKCDINTENQIKGDDVEKNILRITNDSANSYGYLSEKFTLSAKTVYVVTVMAKMKTNENPYIYVVKDNPSDRSEAYLGKIETVADKDDLASDNDFGLPFFSQNLTNGWYRYYMIIITGDTSVSARLALFNGSIDGTQQQEGTVYYDMANYYSIGTYSVDTTPDEDLDEPFETKRDRIKFTAANGYANALEDLSEEKLEEIIASNVVGNFADWDWESIVDEAMKEPEPTPETPTTPAETEPVNLGLLFSLLASVALVGALLIVVVVKIFKKRNKA